MIGLARRHPIPPHAPPSGRYVLDAYVTEVAYRPIRQVIDDAAFSDDAPWQETLRVFTFSMWHSNPQIFAHMSPHVNFKTGSVDVPAYVKAWLEKKGSSTETVQDADGAEVEGNYSEVTSGAEVQALSVPTPLAKRNKKWVRDADTALAAVDADIMQTLIDHGDPHTTPNFTQSHPISPNLNQSHPMSPNLTQSHPISHNLTQSHPI